MRVYIGAPLAGFLAPRLVGDRLHGFARGAALTILNVSVTSPFTSAIIALLFTDTDDFANSYIAALTTTMPLSMLASYFVVGPIVKLLFNNRITPVAGLRALQALARHAQSIARIFGM